MLLHWDFAHCVISGSQSPRPTCSSQRCASVDAAPCCVSQSGYTTRTNVNEQIAAALLRLQHDMAAVLHRLHALEALTLLQVKGCSSCSLWWFVISLWHHAKNERKSYSTGFHLGTYLLSLKLHYICLFMVFYIFFQSRSSSPRQEDSVPLAKKVPTKVFFQVCQIFIQIWEMSLIIYYAERYQTGK